MCIVCVVNDFIVIFHEGVSERFIKRVLDVLREVRGE